jgi:hypothetical protein
MNEEYYLVPKEKMLGLKEWLLENSEGILTVNFVSNLLDLSDKTIEQKAREFYWKMNPNKIIAENTRPDMVIAYSQALKDLKNK